jgi:hypothetical protein
VPILYRLKSCESLWEPVGAVERPSKEKCLLLPNDSDTNKNKMLLGSILVFFLNYGRNIFSAVIFHYGRNIPAGKKSGEKDTFFYLIFHCNLDKILAKFTAVMRGKNTTIQF